MKKGIIFILFLCFVFIGCKKTPTEKEPTLPKTPTEKEETVVPVETETKEPTVVIPTVTPIKTETEVIPINVFESLKELINEYKSSKNASIDIELNNNEEKRNITLIYNYNNDVLESLLYEIHGDKETQIKLKNNAIKTIIDGEETEEDFNSSSKKLLENAFNEMFNTINDLITNELVLNDGDYDLSKVSVEGDLESKINIIITLNYKDGVYAKISLNSLTKVAID